MSRRGDPRHPSGGRGLRRLLRAQGRPLPRVRPHPRPRREAAPARRSRRAPRRGGRRRGKAPRPPRRVRHALRVGGLGRRRPGRRRRPRRAVRRPRGRGGAGSGLPDHPPGRGPGRAGRAGAARRRTRHHGAGGPLGRAQDGRRRRAREPLHALLQGLADPAGPGRRLPPPPRRGGRPGGGAHGGVQARHPGRAVRRRHAQVRDPVRHCGPPALRPRRGGPDPGGPAVRWLRRRRPPRARGSGRCRPRPRPRRSVDAGNPARALPRATPAGRDPRRLPHRPLDPGPARLHQRHEPGGGRRGSPSGADRRRLQRRRDRGPAWPPTGRTWSAGPRRPTSTPASAPTCRGGSPDGCTPWPCRSSVPSAPTSTPCRAPTSSTPAFRTRPCCGFSRTRRRSAA